MCTIVCDLHEIEQQQDGTNQLHVAMFLPPSRERKTSRHQAKHRSKHPTVALADLLCHLHTAWRTDTLVGFCKELEMRGRSC